jgi:phytoene dehydrogenase-like protein
LPSPAGLPSLAFSSRTSFRSLAAGQLPDPLPVMFAVPSASDPSLAPPGKAVAWVSAFVPALPADGRRWPDGNAEAADAALATVELFAPGFRSLVVDAVVTGPAEWEARTGNPHGNPNHIDLTVDQLFGSRPAAGLARYRTPIRGLFLSGAGTHPGGGVTGQPGRNTAMAVLGVQRGKRRSRLSDLRLVPAAVSYLRMRRAL